MTSREFRDRLKRRSRRAGADVPDGVLEPLEAYYRLLAQWNAKINLTALPLDEPTDETFDRLLVEPLAAAQYAGTGTEQRPSRDKAGMKHARPLWVDLGSGSGSPAIPLKIVRPEFGLTMVESKARKAAFLREAIRVLKLAGATVENVRFEHLSGPLFARTSTLVTVRAVRADEALFKASAGLLREGGYLLMFHTGAIGQAQPGFAHVDTLQISNSQTRPALLSRLKRL